MTMDIRLLAVLMQWGYGKKESGESGERSAFFDPMASICREAKPFWYDEFLDDPARIEQELERTVADYAPDVIFFTTYKDQFRPEFLDRLKTRATTIAWFGDDQWRFESYTRRYARHFSFCATTDPWALDKYARLGAKAILSQWAADPKLGAHDALPPDGSFRSNISFVGIRNEVRNWYVGRLQKEGIKVECYGHGWPNGPLPAEKLSSFFQSSRINLNLSNSVQNDIGFIFAHPMNAARFLRSKKRVEQMKARNFEIPLAGGFELSHYAPGLEHYFDIGKEIAIFNSPEQCAAQIRYYLAHPQERCAMAQKAHERACREHTYEHRFRAVLEAALPGRQ